MVMLMFCEGLLFAVAVGVIIGIAVGFVFLLMVCVCKHRSLRYLICFSDIHPQWWFWVYIWGGGSGVTIIADGARTYIATVDHP